MLGLIVGEDYVDLFEEEWIIVWSMLSLAGIVDEIYHAIFVEDRVFLQARFFAIASLSFATLLSKEWFFFMCATLFCMDVYNFLYLPAALEFHNREAEDRVTFPPLADMYTPTTHGQEALPGGQQQEQPRGGICWDDEGAQLAYAVSDSEVGILLRAISSSGGTDSEVEVGTGALNDDDLHHAGATARARANDIPCYPSFASAAVSIGSNQSMEGRVQHPAHDRHHHLPLPVQTIPNIKPCRSAEAQEDHHALVDCQASDARGTWQRGARRRGQNASTQEDADDEYHEISQEAPEGLQGSAPVA